ncbi:hypothetical protein LYNGBM3L_72140 [Moorena producens 3L]|uniref:Uncharacterized protein n=1 Tax=Moorena producens 3L TaxID=489825 RepID=F4Y3B9_9CYAN|nr:hypothetical protein LYNGBM3L_72140 [Moorena producens 3L]
MMMGGDREIPVKKYGGYYLPHFIHLHPLISSLSTDKIKGGSGLTALKAVIKFLWQSL